MSAEYRRTFEPTLLNMPKSLQVKTINLALQGGGSHGAFTWGVLDRLLEENKQLQIEGISGTSAGAMNGAALLQGYCMNGAQGARDALDNFWTSIGDMNSFDLPQRTMINQMLGNWWQTDFNPAALMLDAMQHMFSPYQMNPFNFNPLRTLLNKMLDINAIRSCGSVKLFVCATNVETGRVRVFDQKDISIDALLASGCLPFTFQAVKIDDVPYWDGGYVGNPSLFPLIYGCDSPDIAVVQINPLIRKGIPETPSEIINRVNEISFNASLISEMRAIAFVQHLIDEDHLKNEEAARLKRMNIHEINAEDKLRVLGAASKMNCSMDFLLSLKEIGRATAEQWMKENWDAIGDHSSIDIRETYL